MSRIARDRNRNNRTTFQHWMVHFNIERFGVAQQGALAEVKWRGPGMIAMMQFYE